MFDGLAEAFETQLIREQDAVLMGRRMYDEWSRYWPTSQEQPFAAFINSVKKYVMTSTPLDQTWSNAEAVDEPAAGFVEALKSQVGANIGVHGSIDLAQSLLAADLVDELHLAVGPVLDPIGRRLFGRLEHWRKLELISVAPTPSGVVWLKYRVPA